MGRASLLFGVGVPATVLACVASRGPVHEGPEGGADAGDGGDAGACEVPENNTLSFDLDCTGYCPLRKHYVFEAMRHTLAYPGCAVGNSNLEIKGLTGADMSTLRLDVVPYAGPGVYKLQESRYLLFELSVTPTCGDEIASNLTFLIPNGICMGGVGCVDSGGLPICTFTVDTDCTSGAFHSVAGTFTCSFPDVGEGSHCTLKNGTFAFGGCIP